MNDATSRSLPKKRLMRNRGYDMARFNATIGQLHLEVAYSEVEHWISWNCLVHRADRLVGSLGGTAIVAAQQGIQEAVEDAAGTAIRAKFPLG